ncbi:MAG TPA: methyl-accepting chemotaxis protein [Spirochaetota bacterium]|nr:hypothetical protein [Spirochaetota bacterium]HOD15396.1 methyl-accepting chemotaxis protein [Spirochaetota bacterium]HPG51574.1 methyl-accepting chemotaxis protein [Spirochaetota bacterium]HPN11246.1 methyl-accepting chemotaxis protein [Spirochaetota bacterium]
MNVRLTQPDASSIDVERSPKMVLETRGALFFSGILIVMTVVASIFQYIGGNGIAHILPTTLAYSLCVALGFAIYAKKRKGQNATLLSWLVAFLLTVFATFARYNYALTYDWQYAIEGLHISAVTLVSLFVLQFLYRKSIYLVFFAITFINWVAFLYLAHLNGVPMYMQGLIGGEVIHGKVILLPQAYFIIVMIVIGYINYKNIPVIEDFDARASKQRDRIAKQSEQQKAMAGEIRNRMQELFRLVSGENEELAGFNARLQGEVATFEEISATIEELSSTAEKIHEVANDQVNANGEMAATMEEFLALKEQTKEKLRSTLTNINDVVKQIGASRNVIDDLENSIGEIKDQSDSMAALTALIVDIAERINMLSLNATIEAARAGNQGRGFAVVAAEIGKMAVRTGESVKMIEDTLHRSRQITEHSVTTIKGASAYVKDIMEQMIDSTEKINFLSDTMVLEEKFLKRIDNQMKINVQLSRDTGLGVREQTIALENTNRALDDLNHDVASMAEGINRISRSVTEISGNARSLVSRAAEVKI